MQPDTTQMRRELALHHVVVKCNKPGWAATRLPDNEVITSGRKMRLVIAQAYKLIVRKA